MLLSSILWLTQLHPILRLDPRYGMMLAAIIGVVSSSLLAAWRQRRLAEQEKRETRQRALDARRDAQRNVERRAEVRELIERRLLSAYEHTSRPHLSGSDETERTP
jgi:hypothetical protein